MTDLPLTQGANMTELALVVAITWGREGLITGL
jgi:hypothetical protein